MFEVPAQTFKPAKAERVAAEMTATDDEGWTYAVDHDPTGRGNSRIEIRDENNEFVGYL